MELRSLLNRAARRAYRSRPLARLLFGIDFPALGPRDHYFDVTTWVLVRQVAPLLGPGDRVLDLGTGAHASVGLALRRRVGCRVTACELDPELLDLARANVSRNGAPIEVIASDLLDAVPGPFDAVLFNPPYLPGDLEASLGLAGLRRSQWDGGPDGTRVVERFLDAFERRRELAVAYLGVNAWFVPRERFRELLSARPGLAWSRTLRTRALPAEIHVLRHA